MAKCGIFTPEEEEFQKAKLPDMIDAGLLVHVQSPWCARTKFPRKKGEDGKAGYGKLRMVHSYIPINSATIKDNYPQQRIEPIRNKLGQKHLKCFFQADAANGFWAVPMWRNHIYKTAFVCLFGQLAYTRIGQGLAGSPRTFAKLKDIMTGPIPSPEPEPSLRDVGSTEFAHFVDDDLGASPSFDDMLDFLHHHYLPRNAWAKLTLNPKKCRFFTEGIRVLGSHLTTDGLRPSADKLAALRDWPIPTNPIELDKFCYTLPFLSPHIPGRADLVLDLKLALITELHKVEGKIKRQRRVVGFEWTDRAHSAFERVKREVCDNILNGGNPTKQYHLATDVSATGVGGVLF